MKISNILIVFAFGLIISTPIIEGLALRPLFEKNYRELAEKGGVKFELDEKNEPLQRLTPETQIKNINVIVLSDASLNLKSSNYFYVEAGKFNNHSLNYVVKKDTLFIWNDRDYMDVSKIYSSSGITIGMPAFKRLLVTKQSYLTLDNFKADSLDVKVFNGETSGVVSFLSCQFNNLKCDVGNNSSAFFDSGTKIKNLDLKLENARLVISNTQVENVKSSISATPNTSIEVKGEALKYFLK